MATNLVVPILGEAINEATVIRWNKGIGEPVKRGEELVELETDKAVLSLECPANGQVLKILAEAGTLVRPGDVLAEVGRPGEVAGAPAVQADTVSAAVPAQVDSVTAAAPSQARQQRISPAAKQMAKALGIDPSAVIPSRPGARITTEDVERFAAEAAQTAPIQALPATLPTP